MNVIHRVLLAAVVSWLFSATLGLLFAACASGQLSFATLRVPGVAPIALVGSSLVALLFTPIVMWSLRAGIQNLCRYGPVLWLFLALYVVLVIPRIGIFGPIGLFVLALIGALVLGFVPAVP